MVVRGEQGLGSDMRLNVFDDGPGDGETVKSRSATTDLIQNDEAPGTSEVQNDSRLRHFNHERGSAASEIVGSTNPGKDAVNDGELEQLCRHKGSHLGQNDQEGILPEKGGLATHVRSSHDENLIGRVVHE